MDFAGPDRPKDSLNIKELYGSIPSPQISLVYLLGSAIGAMAHLWMAALVFLAATGE